MTAKSMKRRQVIGNDPLDALISPRAPTKPLEASPRPEPEPETRAHVAPVPTRAPKAAKASPELAAKAMHVRATFHLPADLLDEARDVVVALSGPPVRLTLAGMVQNAIRSELERLRKAHNRGKPFARRDYDLKGGRPIGS